MVNITSSERFSWTRSNRLIAISPHSNYSDHQRTRPPRGRLKASDLTAHLRECDRANTQCATSVHDWVNVTLIISRPVSDSWYILNLWEKHYNLIVEKIFVCKSWCVPPVHLLFVLIFVLWPSGGFLIKISDQDIKSRSHALRRASTNWLL